MPAKYSLSRADFARMRGFKRLHGSLFSLSYGFLPNRTSSGGACVVSAKTAPKAIVRNQIKRRVRATLLPILKELDTSLILVWYAKKTVVGASSKDIRDELLLLTGKTGAIPLKRHI